LRLIKVSSKRNVLITPSVELDGFSLVSEIRLNLIQFIFLTKIVKFLVAASLDQFELPLSPDVLRQPPHQTYLNAKFSMHFICTLSADKDAIID